MYCSIQWYTREERYIKETEDKDEFYMLVRLNPKQDAASKARNMGAQNLEKNIWKEELGGDMGEKHKSRAE